MPEELSITHRGPVAEIQMLRPEVHNAFNARLIAELTAALDALAVNAGVRVIVLSGGGASFSAGADMHWMRAMAAASETDNRTDALALARLLRTLNEVPKPTIARVHGTALGGGVGLIACCDIAIGVNEARFGLTESKLGLLPAVISPYVIAAIGARQARRWFATAEIFDAATALRLGLLHELVSADALDGAIERQIALLLKSGPIASARAKRLVADVLAEPDPDARDAANAELIARLRVSAEGQEGLTAFLDKRTPAWVEPVA